MAKSPQPVEVRCRGFGQKRRADASNLKLHAPEQVRVIPGFIDSVLEEPCDLLEQLFESAVEVVELVRQAVHLCNGILVERPPPFLDAIGDTVDLPTTRPQLRVENREGSFIHTP